MSSRAKGNLLIAHGGGPTAVINCSLYGVIRQAAACEAVGQVLGARGGISGVLEESFIDLRALSEGVIEGLRRTPGSALGSSRRKVGADDCERILDALRRHHVRYFLYNGGNDSMDTALKVHRLSLEERYELAVVGIPKTIDNDLALTDRCPGYGSAARYVAQSVRDVGMDVGSLPTPVSIFETLGRNTGWLAAASALARTDPGSAPHLVYVPERSFETDGFLADLDGVVSRLGWALVVVSEGIRGADGQAVHAAGEAAQLDAFGHAMPGGVACALAGLVSRKLKLRCRSERPGLCARSSILCASPVDQADAEAVGRAAVDAAVAGRGGLMITLLPLGRDAPGPETGSAPLAEVANAERPVPDAFLDPQRAFVTQAFCDYAAPLIGPELLPYARLD